MAALALFQIASIVALIGMGLGWRGVMTKYSGFYDLPTAWSMMFWGLLLGGFYGNMTDGFLLVPYLIEGQITLSSLLICLGLAVIVHLILRRERVRRTGSQPTTGWALGLAVGGMIAMFQIYRMLEYYEDISIVVIVTILLIAIVSPRIHALIFCAHGYKMLAGKRWSAVIATFFWCALAITALYSTSKYPLFWIFMIPPVLLAERKANDWVWAAVPRPARRRLRRIWADASRNIVEEEQ
ncbi:MAG: hypothetical protein HN874_01930 [Euryarchaeota archaeon]|jgi:hypothetical protein|nr:hypothetical protein [Euryarchaeota archaeon]MBT7244191.1 hypothetical protein [Euryarchaeota archaeon]